MAQQKKAAESSSRLSSAPPTPKKVGIVGAKKSGTATPVRGKTVEELDLAGLNLTVGAGLKTPPVEEPPPRVAMAREKLLEEAKKALEGKDDKRAVSLVVIGKDNMPLSLLRSLNRATQAMSMLESPR